MKPNGNKNFVKKGLYENKKKLKITSKLNLKLANKIIDTINFSLLILVFTFSFLSLNSQRKWSNIYSNLTKTKINNNNLIDYIANTERFYIVELESLSTIKKTTPKDLIYLEKISQNKENIFYKKIINITSGINDSKYQIGY